MSKNLRIVCLINLFLFLTVYDIDVDLENDTSANFLSEILDAHNTFDRYSNLRDWSSACPFKGLVSDDMMLNTANSLATTPKSHSTIANKHNTKLALVFSESELAQTNLTPLIYSLYHKRPIKLTNFRNTFNFTAVFILLLAAGLLLITLSLIICRKTSLRKIQVPKSCLVFFTIILIILWGTALLLLLLPFRFYMSVLKETKQALICEATRIPHALVNGDVTVDNKSPFLGLSLLQDWVGKVAGNIGQLSSESIDNVYYAAREVDLKNLKNQIFLDNEALRKKYRNVRIRDAHGALNTPLLISNDLENLYLIIKGYKAKYEQYAERNSAYVNLLMWIHRDKDHDKDQDKDGDSITDLNAALNNTIDTLLTFWNQMLQTSFGQISFFETRSRRCMLALIILFLVNTMLLLLFCCIKKRSKSKYQNVSRQNSKNNQTTDAENEYLNMNRTILQTKDPFIKQFMYKAMSIVSIALILFTLVSTLYVLQITFTTYYGCAAVKNVLDKDKDLDPQQKAYLEERLYLFGDMQTLFERCFFSKDKEDRLNVSSFVSILEQQQSLVDLVGMFDTLKFASNVSNKMIEASDIAVFTQFGLLTHFEQTGSRFSFENVYKAIDILDDAYKCAGKKFVMTTRAVRHMKLRNKSFIFIVNQNLPKEECVKDYERCLVIFNRLVEYTKDIQKLAARLRSDVSNFLKKSGLLYNIQKFWDQITSICNQLSDFNKFFKLDFKNLPPGSLFELFDCRRVQTDLKILYDNLCLHHLPRLVGFSDLLLIMVIVELLFLLLISILNLLYSKRVEAIQENNLKIHNNSHTIVHKEVYQTQVETEKQKTKSIDSLKGKHVFRDLDSQQKWAMDQTKGF